jgi:hypothetical protein
MVLFRIFRTASPPKMQSDPLIFSSCGRGRTVPLSLPPPRCRCMGGEGSTLYDLFPNEFWGRLPTIFPLYSGRLRRESHGKERNIQLGGGGRIHRRRRRLHGQKSKTKRWPNFFLFFKVPTWVLLQKVDSTMNLLQKISCRHLEK